MGNTAELLDLSIPKSLRLRIVSSNFGSSIGASFDEMHFVSYGETQEAAISSLLLKCGLLIDGSPKEAASKILNFKRLGDTPIEIVYENLADLC